MANPNKVSSEQPSAGIHRTRELPVRMEFLGRREPPRHSPGEAFTGESPMLLSHRLIPRDRVSGAKLVFFFAFELAVLSFVRVCVDLYGAKRRPISRKGNFLAGPRPRDNNSKQKHCELTPTPRKLQKKKNLLLFSDELRWYCFVFFCFLTTLLLLCFT
jgi:hypothetical protein